MRCLELRLLPDEGIRDDKVEDQVRVRCAPHHAEVVQRQLRVNGADRFLHKGAMWLSSASSVMMGS